MVRKRLVLDQIPIFMEGKMFRGEGGNGLTLREFWSFEPLISTPLSGGMGLVSIVFFIASALVFF